MATGVDIDAEHHVTLTLSEKDIPGASVREPFESYTVAELHWWLHQYYSQIQGQLAITQRLWCDFIRYTPKGISVERIDFDSDYWKTTFYAN